MSKRYSSPGPQAGPLDLPAPAQDAVAVAVVAYLLWGLLTIYWKQLERFDAAELILWRMSCAAVVMAVVVSLPTRS